MSNSRSTSNLNAKQQYNSVRPPSSVRLRQNSSQVKGELTLPGIQTPGNAHTSSFFITDIKDQPAAGQANRTQAVSPQILSQRQSPSRQNIETIQLSPFQAFKETLGYDEMVERERRKANTESMRSKKLLLMSQLDMRSRLQLGRDIAKRQEKHEKNLKMAEKQRNEELSKMAEKHATKKALCA